jgi:competence protein ComGA
MIQDKASEILRAAVAAGVYDVTVSAVAEAYRVYFRNKEGRTFFENLDFSEGLALLAHFKFLAGMNTGEKRRTQLGSCWYDLGEQVDAVQSASSENQYLRRLRLSTVGDFEGRESLVIRILHEGTAQLDFWFDEEKLAQLHFSRGLYLFAGPVGSGKTSLMMDLARREFGQRQVLTIEDPVELVDGDFLQLQVNEQIGNSYDELIKLSLRHRPDLLIVGEIRDKETARAVLRASLTGYTVFSTVHARSVAGVWMRLLELGLSEWELKNSLQSVIYQRLIAGKGVVDIAETEFENWDTTSWNGKIERLFTEGHLTAFEAESEKIKSCQARQADSTDGKFAG